MTLIHRLLSYLMLALAALLLAACQADEGADVPTTDGRVRVRLLLSVAQRGTDARQPVSKATFDDTRATDGEMLKTWTVAIIGSDNRVKKVLQSNIPAGQEREDDATYATLDAGTYTFFTLANITPAEVGFTLTEGMELTPGQLQGLSYTLSANKAAAADFAGGLPMSNIQTCAVTKTTADNLSTVQLYAVRMPVKLQLQITNDLGSDVEIRSLELTDVQTDGKAFPLLPQTTGDAPAWGINTDGTPCAYAAPVQPQDTARNKLTLADTDRPVSLTATGEGSTTTLTTYINPSRARSENFGHFMLYITTFSGGQESRRSVMLDWTEMARNDLRVIPVHLTDYNLMLHPQQYTAIGVLPPTSVDVGDLLEIDFNWYGEFHLMPYVEKRSAPSTITEEKEEDGKTETVIVDNPQKRVDQSKITYSLVLPGVADELILSGPNRSDNTSAAGFDPREAFTFTGNQCIFRTYDARSLADGGVPMVYWDTHRKDGIPYFEGELANVSGEALTNFQLKAEFTDDNGRQVSLQRRFRIKMTAVDFTQMSIRLRALGIPPSAWPQAPAQ